MKQTKLILLLSILLLVVSQGCSNKPPKVDNDVIRIESTEIAFDDSIRRPYEEYIYDDKGYLERSVTRHYGKDSLGRWKEKTLITCDYIRSGKTIKIEGVKEDKDVNTGISQKQDIKVKLECDASGRIVKRTEQPEGYTMPLVDEFEWEGDFIKRKKRYYDGDLTSDNYQDIVEYTYKDGNMVFADLKFIMILNNTRIQINGTIKADYDTLHLSYQTRPDESALILNSNLELYAAKHSRNESPSFVWSNSLFELDTKNKKQTQGKDSALSGALDVLKWDENGYPIISSYLMRFESKSISYIDPVPNSETQNEEQYSVVYTKYKDMRKK
ncbi:hypothetical protein M2451_000004 [Dysgonomonas sp. PFB1-18]|uniref:hypothetical protein n=1 Tax=unclassified Dysgonomonas TaxID=2630389 RepID=UPI0024749DE7|nr:MULTISPECIES: hypothetical protein [unclassified Dysgonomonas]MDH6307554.1 hypothetical protein [Dysgonomonas sp. PF1-14]MDH6337472.1 hypothetical protein [Dysgonomonas sp. PF1-16]MDH6378697.1 hypothetical protein [Dysgonomonas sp. PFB1-18]MDH6399115.1 hypothetical protein [Dysgonomonas sp. PF1-23]